MNKSAANRILTALRGNRTILYPRIHGHAVGQPNTMRTGTSGGASWLHRLMTKRNMHPISTMSIPNNRPSPAVNNPSFYTNKPIHPHVIGGASAAATGGLISLNYFMNQKKRNRPEDALQPENKVASHYDSSRYSNTIRNFESDYKHRQKADKSVSEEHKGISTIKGVGLGAAVGGASGSVLGAILSDGSAASGAKSLGTTGAAIGGVFGGLLGHARVEEARRRRAAHEAGLGDEHKREELKRALGVHENARVERQLGTLTALHLLHDSGK